MVSWKTWANANRHKITRCMLREILTQNTSRSYIFMRDTRLLIIFSSEVRGSSGSYWYILTQLFWSKMHCPIFKIKELFFWNSLKVKQPAWPSLKLYSNKKKKKNLEMNFPENHIYLFMKIQKPHILRMCGEAQFGIFFLLQLNWQQHFLL